MTSLECVQEANQWLEFHAKNTTKVWALELAQIWLDLANKLEQAETVSGRLRKSPQQ